MSSKIEVVIPVGVGNPKEDAPKIDLLEQGLASIKNQTIPVTLTVAMDRDLPKSKQKVVKKYADKIKVYPKASYFRPGGIWLKIWECWEESDAKYVAWQGYDDISHHQRFEFQIEAIERTGANACFGIQKKFSDDINKAKMVNDGNLAFGSYVGGHPEFMGGFLLRKDAILQSGLGRHRYKWSHYFEGLLFAYIVKTGSICNSDGTFCFRYHPGSIASTNNPEWVEKQRKITKYTYEQCLADWASLNFQSICQNLK